MALELSETINPAVKGREHKAYGRTIGCHRCGRKLRAGDIWTDEHVLALENGGTNDWENRDITCSWCFKPKNAEDDKTAAKTRAVATRCIIPEACRQKSSLAKRDGYRYDWKARRYVREDQP